MGLRACLSESPLWKKHSIYLIKFQRISISLGCVGGNQFFSHAKLLFLLSCWFFMLWPQMRVTNFWWPFINVSTFSAHFLFSHQWCPQKLWSTLLIQCFFQTEFYRLKHHNLRGNSKFNFLREGGGVNFPCLPWRGDSNKLSQEDGRMVQGWFF